MHTRSPTRYSHGRVGLCRFEVLLYKRKPGKEIHKNKQGIVTLKTPPSALSDGVKPEDKQTYQSVRITKSLAWVKHPYLSSGRAAAGGWNRDQSVSACVCVCVCGGWWKLMTMWEQIVLRPERCVDQGGLHTDYCQQLVTISDRRSGQPNNTKKIYSH